MSKDVAEFKRWTDEEISEEVQRLQDSIYADGWDDVIYYRYEVVEFGIERLFQSLLNQRNVIGHAQETTRPGNITVTGVPITFGGIKVIKSPNVNRITSYQLYDPGNEELEEVATGLVFKVLTDGYDVAEKLAEEFIAEYNGVIPDGLVCGFFYSFTPAKFGELNG